MWETCSVIYHSLKSLFSSMLLAKTLLHWCSKFMNTHTGPGGLHASHAKAIQACPWKEGVESYAGETTGTHFLFHSITFDSFFYSFSAVCCWQKPCCIDTPMVNLWIHTQVLEVCMLHMPKPCKHAHGRKGWNQSPAFMRFAHLGVNPVQLRGWGATSEAHK